MLGHVVAQKKTRGRRKPRASLVPPPTPKNTTTGQQQTPKTTSAEAKMTPKKGSTAATRPRRTRKAVQDVSNHKITEFFPVRRSNRKTGKQIAEEKKDALYDAIYNGTNEASLLVYTDPVKGRGVRAGRGFVKNEFVIEYKGEMMDYTEAKALEDEYSRDHSIGSYMYFFTHKNKRWCVDATKESKFKGRLINHSFLRPNLRTKVVEFDNGLHHLILVAKRDIKEGEELLYDYGDRSPDTIAKNPWLMTT